MRTNLLSLVLAPAVLAAAALTAQPAMAESHTVNIPFNFVASGHACPAGNYSIRANSDSDFIYLGNQKQTFILLLVPGDSTAPGHRVVLTFDVYGQNHLLRTVSYGRMITNRLDKQPGEAIPAAEQIAIGQ